MNTDKKLNLSKYAFLNHLKGDLFNWLTCDANYYKAALENESLKNATPWRFKQLSKESVERMELPSPIISGMIASDWSRNWAEANYPNHKIIEGSKWDVETSIEKTKLWLSSDENLIIFEAGFKYNDFRIRTDILIKTGDKVEILELKGVTSPHSIHAIDIFFQREIIIRNHPEAKDWIFELLILDSEYTESFKYSKLEKGSKLFIRSPIMLTALSKPAKKDGIKWTLRRQLEGIKTPDKDNKPAKFQYLNDFFEQAEQVIISKNFDSILDHIKKIQMMNTPPEVKIENKSYEYLDSDYMDYFYDLAGVPKHGSIFELKGGSTFSNKKKLASFNNGVKKMKEIDNIEIVRKDIGESLKENETRTQTETIINRLKESNRHEISGYGTIIQKHYLDSNKKFMNIDGIKNSMRDYENGPIYMYDFETADLSVPLVEGAHPYQQIPYQFSIHVITNPKDYDFATLKNVVHYEWLAQDFETFSIEFWNEFIKVFETHGEGVYVSWNMSFEKTRINEAIEMHNFKPEVYEWLDIIVDETVDLMEIFNKKYYYHDELHGSYSIKYVGPHFVEGEINYKNLNNIQKGDQSASEAKKWMIDRNDDEWESIRHDMLEYCKYDTLLMVAILQRMQEAFKEVKELAKQDKIKEINDKYDLSLEQLRKWE